MTTSKYKRILLKLSGESLQGKQNYGHDVEVLNAYAEQIKIGRPQVAPTNIFTFYLFRAELLTRRVTRISFLHAYISAGAPL